MLNRKNKYLSQQISQKFKNKHRNRNNYPTSFARRQWTKYMKNCYKKYEKHQCQFGTKKELKRLKKKHLIEMKCKRTKKYKQNDSFLDIVVKGQIIINYHFIKCAYLDPNGVAYDESIHSKDVCMTYCHYNYDTDYECYDYSPSLIVDTRYDFEEIYNWKCLKSMQKNKYLNQMISKKFKNKHNKHKNKYNANLTKRKRKRQRLKNKYKRNKERNKKISTKQKCYYEYQHLYDALNDIDDFNDTDYDEQEEFNEEKENEILIEEKTENHKKIDHILNDILFLRYYSYFIADDMYFNPLSIKPSIPYLSSGTRHIISNTLRNNNHKYHQFEITDSLLGSYTFSGYMNNNEESSYIIIDDIDINIKSYWNRKICNISMIDNFNMFDKGRRVLFEMNVKLFRKPKLNTNKRSKICWAHYFKDKFIISAYNVRLAKQNILDFTNNDINTLISEYLSIYLGRYNMYIPNDIERLIRVFFSKYMESDTIKHYNHYFHTFIKKFSKWWRKEPKNHTIKAEYGTFCKIGILANPHQLYQYIRKPRMSWKIWYHDHDKKWWENINCRYYSFDTFVNGENIIELKITSRNKLILKRFGRFRDKIDKFDTSYTYYPFITFDIAPYSYIGYRDIVQIIHLKPTKKHVIDDPNFSGYW